MISDLTVRNPLRFCILDLKLNISPSICLTDLVCSRVSLIGNLNSLKKREPIVRFRSR